MISVFQLSPLLSLKGFEGSCLKGSEYMIFFKFQVESKMLVATMLLFLVLAVAAAAESNRTRHYLEVDGTSNFSVSLEKNVSFEKGDNFRTRSFSKKT